MSNPFSDWEALDFDEPLTMNRDIVDHTYWDGNVWKMLLGAVNDWYDDDPS